MVELYDQWKAAGHAIGETDDDGIVICAGCNEVMTFPVKACQGNEEQPPKG